MELSITQDYDNLIALGTMITVRASEGGQILASKSLNAISGGKLDVGLSGIVEELIITEARGGKSKTSSVPIAGGVAVYSLKIGNP